MTYAVQFVTPLEHQELVLGKWSRRQAGKLIDPTKNDCVWTSRTQSLRKFRGHLEKVKFDFPENTGSLPVEFSEFKPLNYKELTYLYVLSLWSSVMCRDRSPRYQSFFDSLVSGEWESIKAVIDRSISINSKGQYLNMEELWKFLIRNSLNSVQSSKVEQVTINV